VEQPRQEERKDPFETDDLVGMRWEQRRTLRFFPEEVMEHGSRMAALLGLPEESVCRLVELHLREEAATGLGELKSVLTNREQARRAAECFALVNSHYKDVEQPRRFGLRSLRAAADEMVAARIPRQIEEDDYEKMFGVALLLAWADLLAGDGYQDPGLRSADRSPD
jgi:hypothetical protein